MALGIFKYIIITTITYQEIFSAPQIEIPYLFNTSPHSTAPTKPFLAIVLLSGDSVDTATLGPWCKVESHKQG